jgi:mono/diheme cytochrome c family protein
MIKITMTLCGLLCAGAVYAEGNVTKGKKIYSASECVHCHQSNEMFTRKDRKVKTLSALDSQVRKCDAQLSTNLFDDEIKDVVAYLNQAHYKFSTKKTTNLHIGKGRDKQNRKDAKDEQ